MGVPLILGVYFMQVLAFMTGIDLFVGFKPGKLT